MRATQYKRDVYGFGYGFSNGNHEFDFNYHRIDTDDTGTPSLPMNIDWFETDTWNASYRGDFESFGLELRLYGSEVDHGMSNSLLRPTPDFSNLPLPPFVGDDARNVLTDSEESGFKIAVDFEIGGGDMVLGLEGKDSEHNATVYDPDFAPFFVNNFNNSEAENVALCGQ